MGFNIEEYEMYDNDSYSNGSGLFGGKLKEKLGIGTGSGSGTGSGAGLFGGKIKEKLGIGSGSIKEKLGIGDGKALGIVVNTSKNEEYKANKNIISGNVDTTSVASNTKPLNVVEEAKVKADDKQKRDEIIAQSNAIKKVTSLPLNTNIALTNTGATVGTPSEIKKSKKGLYIGVGVLVIGIVTIILIKRRK